MKQFKVILFALVFMVLGTTLFAQSITIQDPHSGDTWCKGATCEIKWVKSGSMHDLVKIRLYNAAATVKILDIVNSTPNNGSYNWTIPGSVTNGNYRIRVKTLVGEVKDDSDIFAIAGCSAITVTAPTTGDAWGRGLTHTIKWTKTGGMDGQVKIRLYNAAGNTKIRDIVDDTPNNNSYKWPIPADVPLGDYRIRVKTLDGKVEDDSNVFKIKRKFDIGKFKDDLVPQLIKIKILKPSASSFWKGGTKHDIVWENKFTKGKKYRIDLYNYKGTKFIQNIYTKSFMYLPIGTQKASPTSKYSWVVPNIGPKKCKIKISVIGGGARGTSEMFTITIGTTVKKYKVYASTYNKHRWKKQSKGPGTWDSAYFPANDPGPGKLRIGYENHYEDEAFGYHYMGYIYRGHTYFDVKKFQGKGLILKANLHFTFYSGKDCGVRIYKNLEKLTDLFKGSVEFITHLNQMTSIVQGWVGYPDSNFGLLWTGTNEKFSHNNKKCIGYYKNIYLELEILEKK